jgi:basic amino acid/polyamine antiporter, APA family
LGVNFPSSGGEYVYLTHAFGPEWGFMTGWVSFFAGFSAPIAVTALAFTEYLATFSRRCRKRNTPIVLGSGMFSLHLGPAQAVACGLIAVLTILNCLGVGLTAKMQNSLTTTNLCVMAGFVVLGLAFGTGSWSHFSQHAVRTSTASLPAQFAISLLWVMFGYSGWNAATYVAEEVRRPERTLPAALAAGTALVAVLYLGLNVVYIYSTPLEQMKGVIKVGALSASNLFGPGIAGVFSALMALSIVATVNAELTIGPRVYYAMAKNRAFFPAAGKCTRASHAGVRHSEPGPVRHADDADFVSRSADLHRHEPDYFTVLSVAALMVFRSRRPGWQRLRAIDFAYPLLPVSYILVGAAMVIFGIKEATVASLTAFATVGAGALVYHFASGRGRENEPSRRNYHRASHAGPLLGDCFRRHAGDHHLYRPRLHFLRRAVHPPRSASFPAQMGWAFGAFGLAYSLFEMPGGYLGDRMGPRKVLLRIVLWWSFFTAATGRAWNLASITTTQFLFGAGEAGCFPNLTKAFTTWLPAREKVRAQGIMWLSARWGGAFTPPLVAMVMGFVGWRNAFALFGLLGMGLGGAVLPLVSQRSAGEPKAERRRAPPAEPERDARHRPRRRSLGQAGAFAPGVDALLAVFFALLRMVFLHHLAAHLSARGAASADPLPRRGSGFCRCSSADWATRRVWRRGLAAAAQRERDARPPHHGDLGFAGAASFLVFSTTRTAACRPCWRSRWRVSATTW